MPTVHFSSDLLAYTGGLETIVVEASRVVELKQSLIGRFPPLTEQLGRLAVAIDGEIYNDADYHPLDPDSEIYFVPRIAGG
jgi:molybdopterin converting factor small subunit